ncbi:UNVERIFIED_ORG: hypothetical protein GGD59_006625 [Rhizobium esperanzae]
MPVTTENPGPYAPSTAITGLIERHRNKGLPSPVDAEVLGRAGISDSLIPRTLQTMQTLDLLDEDKRPTEIFEGLRKASEPEFRKRVAEWLDGAYADALAFIEPSTAEETDIRDAFRSYKPVGQQDRMVTLFVGLYAYAGIRTERAPRQPMVRKPPGSKINSTSRATRPARVVSAEPTPAQSLAAPLSADGLPPVLAGLLASLPAQGQGWSADRREAFVKTFQAVLDFCYPIVQSEHQNNNKIYEGDRE